MQWLKDKPIAVKIMLLVGTILTISLTLSAFSMLKMGKIADDIKGIAHETIPLVQLTSHITIRQIQSTSLLEQSYRALDIPVSGEQNDAMAVMARYKNMLTDFDRNIGQVQKLLQETIAHSSSKAIENTERNLYQQLQRITAHHQQFEQNAFALIDKLKSGANGAELAPQAAALEQQQQAVNTELLAFIDKLNSIGESVVANAQADEQHALWQTIFLTSLALLVGIVVSLLISRQVVTVVSQANEVATMMAAGDFGITVEVNRKDELGRLLKCMDDMAGSLSNTVSAIINHAEQLSGSAKHLSDMARSNREAVNSQQNNTEQASSAIHQLSATITQVAHNAQDTLNSSHQAESSIRQGTNTMDRTQQLSEQLVASTDRSRQMIDLLRDSTDKIKDFVTIVGGIAEQTNLLALNAAIEAARAGEQGRGFAVVADEVRALASRSQQATSEIQTLINTLAANASSAVEAIYQSSEQIVETSRQIDEAKQELHHGYQALSQLNDANTQMAAASEQQSTTAEVLSQNVADIRDAGLQVLASTSDTEKASAVLAEQADALRQLMAQFRVRTA